MITAKFLREHPKTIFVFGDNLIRRGKGGAAILRDEPNTWGFITKKYPNNKDCSFFKPAEYLPTFVEELGKLTKEIKDNQHKTYLISTLGSGLANRYKIYETIIEPGLKLLKQFKNVTFLNA